MKVTLDILKQICSKTKEKTLEQYVIPLNETAQYYEIDKTKPRLAAFLAQLIHESGSFVFTAENLNYGAAGLMLTFKKYFPTMDLAKQYERKPEKIANRVYANRMGNGTEESGDGWKFRGRGLIQLTGKFNYTKFATDLNISIDQCIIYLETPAGATRSAGWFWASNKLNDFCDKNDFVGLTKKINGGTNGLEDRKHHYELALRLL